MKLTICIPTFNREDYLKKNIEELISIIRELNFENTVGLFVSDNCSADGTAGMVQSMMEQNRDINIYFSRNDENKGAVYNVIYMLNNAKSEFIMLLGDDDYISKDYLRKTIDSLNKGIKCIVPSYMNILPDGSATGRGRDLGKKSKKYKSGYKNCLENSWRGHQLSGLVVDRELIMNETKRSGVFNSYLQIYWIAYSCMKGDTLHLTEYPIKITAPPKGGKTWGYGDDGLISEVFVNYKLIEDITLFQRHRLEMKFLTKQYWRYAMYIKKNPFEFIKCIYKITVSENTSKLTRIVFPFTFLFILMGQSVQLLFTGKLLSTLKVKVDI